MGDRGNIAVLQSEGDQVWFYAHWSGYCRAETVQRALARNERWNDESYLARIIFCEWVGEKDWNESTSFGISCRLQDNEYSIIVVDVPRQRVFFIQKEELKDRKVPGMWEPKESWGFPAWVALSEAELKKASR